MFVRLDADSEASTVERKKRVGCMVTLIFFVAVAVGAVVFLYLRGILKFGGSNSNDSPPNKSNTTSGYITLDTSIGKIKGNILKGASAYPIETESNNNNNGREDSNSSYIYEFLGIRYGKAPTGQLRFQPCVLNNNSFGENTDTNTSIYDATTYGDMCPQESNYTSPIGVSEDCLFLNIWTPASAVNSIYNDDGLPVMVFIHGGSFLFGAGSDANGSLFVKQGNNEIVYVSINYRMGIFGFLQSEMLYDEGNQGTYGFNWPSYGGLNGLNDQISAIKWVYENIHNFGGNGKNITIFGESAGGQSVCSLTISPLLYNTNLFYQSIVESGITAR